MSRTPRMFASVARADSPSRGIGHRNAEHDIAHVARIGRGKRCTQAQILDIAPAAGAQRSREPAQRRGRGMWRKASQLTTASNAASGKA
jgi:hypothetical protein